MSGLPVNMMILPLSHRMNIRCLLSGVSAQQDTPSQTVSPPFYMTALILASRKDLNMYTYPWYHWITFFYVYCFLGWIVESTFVSLQKHRLVNRGFLRLPMIPLYGTGAVMMLWVSLPVKDNLILVYIAGFFAASALEYVTGWIMERLFKVRYWDYTDQKFNINGYVCLGTSIAWGFLTILMTEVLHKPIEKFVLSLNSAVEFSFLAVVSVLFITDTIQSVRAALDLGHALETLTKIKADLDDLQVQLALLKAEASDRADDIREGVRDWASDLHDAKQERVSAIREEAAAIRDEASSIREETAALWERRHQLRRRLTSYHRSLLRGNPGATSKRFNEALKDLKKYLEQDK